MLLSCKFSVKVSLMSDNPFLAPPLCKLNHISLCFIQISTKSPAKLLIPFRKSSVSHPRCFGPLGKFQHNMKISIKTARVFRLSVSYEYAYTKRNEFHKNDAQKISQFMLQGNTNSGVGHLFKSG